MNAIRLRNYRCFEDTGLIELKRINLLVGANSSGKSSFLKFFPLLKQSLNIRLNGVFRWLGNDVDFKDFKNTVQEGKDTIWIDYKIDDFFIYSRLFNNKILNNRKSIPNVYVSFSIVPLHEHFDMIENIHIEYAATSIDIKIENDNVSLFVNGLSTQNTKGLQIITQNNEAIFPRLLFQYKGDQNHGWMTSPSILRQKIVSEVRKLGGRFSEGHRFLLFDTYPISFDNFKKGLDGMSDKVVSNLIAQHLYDMCIMYNINSLIDSLNINLLRVASNVVYIKPVRATIERYYRFQNLDMDDIDADGANLPMFLYNLERKALDAFNNWLSMHFHFEVFIKSSDGHIELLVSETGKTPRNTVDLGFGYTQLLPILAVIWKAIFLEAESVQTEASSEDHIVVIEQPELHLHPKFQGKFAEMLSIITRLGHEKKLNVRFIIETHSETILNKLGDFVESRLLYPEDVSVLMIEQDNNGCSQIKPTEYTKEGFLKEWPKNFMEDVDDD